MVGQVPSETEQQRQQENNVKMGLLLVSLGVAPKEKVFLNGDVPETKITSLGDAGVFAPPGAQTGPLRKQPVTWYNPLSWFRSGGAGKRDRTALAPISPPHHVTSADERALLIASEMNTSERSNALPAVGAAASASAANQSIGSSEPVVPATLPSAEGLLEGLGSPPSSHNSLTALMKDAAEAVTSSLRQPQPHIDFRQLTDAEISRLAPTAKLDRERVLKMEESIHTMLDNIEKTKQKYLTPARHLECESEVDAVVECFHRVNLQLSAMPATDGVLKRSRVALNCGEPVDRLRRCSHAAVSKYVLQ